MKKINRSILIIENKKVFQKYKKEVLSHLNIYFDQLEEFGFEWLIVNLEQDILKAYNEKLEEFKNLTLKKAKQLAKEEWFKEYFDVKSQHTKAFKCLSDVRTWREKATSVNLEEEYDLNYELTSSLLHFTSYSLFTSNQIDDDEIAYNYMLLNQYISQIINNISNFSKVMIFNLFDVVIDIEK